MTGGFPTPGVSARSLYLLGLITKAIEAGDFTPRYAALVPAIEEAGFTMPPKTISWMVQDLKRRGLLIVEGEAGRPIYGVAGVEGRTVARPAAETGHESDAVALAQDRVRNNSRGWPKVTPESAASYDRAVRYQLFARHEMQRVATETRVHGAVRGEVERQSFVGCSAAECCG